MKVRDRMTPNPITTSLDTSVGKVWELMKEHNLRRIPVMDRGQLVGILTRTDFGTRPDLNLRGTSVATRYFSTEQEELLRKVRVRDLIGIDQALVTIGPDAYVEHAAQLLRDNKIGGLPVVDENGKLLGIITLTDVLDAFLDVLAINRPGSRINIWVEDKPEVLANIGRILSLHGVKLQNIVIMDIKEDQQLLILRINTTSPKAILDDFTASGYRVESVIIKQKQL